jgi:hypothetical protein
LKAERENEGPLVAMTITYGPDLLAGSNSEGEELSAKVNTFSYSVYRRRVHT